MDHLDRPQDPDPPIINIPVLCLNPVDNSFLGDPEDWPFGGYMHSQTEPSFTRMALLDTLKTLDFRSWLSFLQTWFYFGLLRAVFESEFVLEDFLAPSVGGRARLDSSKLPSLIERQLQKHEEMTEEARQSAKSRIRSWLEYVSGSAEVVESCMLDHYAHQTPFPEIMLSIRILAQTLFCLTRDKPTRGLPGEGSQEEGQKDTRLRPSMLPLYRHMTPARGWCPQRRLHFCSSFSPATLYYIVCLKIDSAVDHSCCEGEETCVAHRVAPGFPGYHAANECEPHGCLPLAPSNPGKLHSVLRDGGIPIVTASRTAGGQISLEYAEASPSTDYTAISYVCSDGLGSPLHNQLPLCQIQRLLKSIHVAARSRHRPRVVYFGHTWFWRWIINLEYWLADLWISLRWQQDYLAKPVSFWIDIYCIPSALSDAHAALQQQGISRMVPTYALARRTLILDQGLQRLTSALLTPELLARTLLCAWGSRYWTRQELLMSNRPLMLLSDWSTLPYDELAHQEYHMSMSDVHMELSDASIRNRAGTFEAFLDRGIHDPEGVVRDALHFGRVWNSFSGRACSVSADMHGILANQLGLSAGQIVALPASQRMRAICASYKALPLQLLTTLYPSHPHSVLPPRRHGIGSSAMSERWLPDFPDTRGIINGSVGTTESVLRVTSQGLCMESSDRVLLIELDEPPSWLMEGHRKRVIFTSQTSDHVRDLSFYVPESSKARLAGLEGQTQPTLLLIDVLQRPGHHTLRAACLMLSGLDDGHTLRTYYLCPVIVVVHPWVTKDGLPFDRAITRANINARELHDLNLLLECDMSNWPKLSRIRQPESLQEMISLQYSIFPIVCICASIVLATTVLIRHSDATRWLIWTSITLPILAYLSMIAIVANGIAMYYLAMETFYENSDTQRPWTERLARTLPSSPTNNTMNEEEQLSVVTVPAYGALHAIIFAASTLEWLRSTISNSYRYRRVPDSDSQST